jgi:uncharacterized protein YcnI
MPAMIAPPRVCSFVRDHAAWPVAVLLGALSVRAATAQVALAPSSLEPATFERLALRVANPDSSPVVRVRLAVPAALAVLGVDAPAGWRWRLEPASDTTPTVIEWWGDSLAAGAFREFPVLARLQADAQPLTLVFPVRLEHADGRTTVWDRAGDAAPPTMEIRGTTVLSTRGAVALAGGALGVAALALVLGLFSASRQRASRRTL